ncbi:MAG: Ig-like domain-containing protein, partial [Candidatus Wolfebacteria bacterium]|nr:Ig-like domain-containing protein [Candidatus Wolfebacteria bacterium]
NNTVYTVTITTNVSDTAGNQLESEYPWQFTTATQYDIALYTAGGGWNLVSLPIIPNDENISTVLGDAEGNIEAVWTYDPSHPNAVDGWLAYIPGDPDGTNNLDTMTAGYGYWISVNGNVNISGAGNLLTAGPNLPPSRDLSAGWNLVGYYQIPGESSSNPGSAFSSLGGTYTGLWGFNNQTGNFMSTVNEILPGDAFWISLPSAKTYTPSNVNNAT